MGVLHRNSFSYLFLSIVLALFFAADSNLFNCVFVSHYYKTVTLSLRKV